MTELQDLKVRENKNFYVTFPVKYSRGTHPMGSYITPHGYAVIRAKDEAEAHTAAYAWYGQAWAFLYTEDDFDSSYQPLGCIEALAVVSDDGALIKIDHKGL